MEWLVVELIQSLSNGLVELCQGQKTSVAQCRQDVRQDRRSVMFGKVIVGFIQRDLALSVRDDAGFEVVALQNACDTAFFEVLCERTCNPAF